MGKFLEDRIRVVLEGPSRAIVIIVVVVLLVGLLLAGVVNWDQVLELWKGKE